MRAGPTGVLEHPTLGRRRRSQPLVAAAGWALGAGLVGGFTAALFAGALRLSRPLYLVFYLVAMGAYVYAYVRANRVEWVALLKERWKLGLAVGAAFAVFSVQTVLVQPASAAPAGVALGAALVWMGLLYGAMDGVVLSVLPAHAVLSAMEKMGLTASARGRAAAGLLALAASAAVIALYHLGYPEFRGAQVLVVVGGVALQTVGYLVTRSPLAPLLAHVAMHAAAVLHGFSSVSQLPPHYLN